MSSLLKMTSHKCCYIFSRGAKKGQQCTVELPIDQKYCAPHYRQQVKSGKLDPSTPLTQLHKQSPTTIVKDSAGSVILRHPAEALTHSDVIKEMKKKENSSIAQDSPKEDPPISDDSPVKEGDQAKVEDKTVIEFLPFEDEAFNQKPVPNVRPSSSPVTEKPSTTEKQPRDPIMEAATDEEFRKELMIKEYYAKWPRLEKELPLEKRGSMTADEWLKLIQQYMTGSMLDGAFKQGFTSVCTITEVLGPRIGLNTAGYTRAMLSIPDLDETLTLIRLRHQDKFAEVTPEMRLAGAMCIMLFEVHNLNTFGASGNNKEKASRAPTYKE